MNDHTVSDEELEKLKIEHENRCQEIKKSFHFISEHLLNFENEKSLPKNSKLSQFYWHFLVNVLSFSLGVILFKLVYVLYVYIKN